MANANDIDVDFEVDKDRLELHLERNFRIIREILSAHFADTLIAGETNFLLFDVDSGQFQRILVGAADSDSIGFRRLKVAN